MFGRGQEQALSVRESSRENTWLQVLPVIQEFSVSFSWTGMFFIRQSLRGRAGKKNKTKRWAFLISGEFTGRTQTHSFVR